MVDRNQHINNRNEATRQRFAIAKNALTPRTRRPRRTTPGDLECHDDDSRFRDEMAFPPVFFRIEPDLGPFLELDSGIHDRAAKPAVASNLDVVKQNRAFDLGIAVHANPGGEDAVHDTAARHNASRAHHRINADAHPAPLFREDKFRRRVLRLVGPQRPCFIVEIKDRGDGNQIHVRFVVGVQCSDVAPIG